jgi:hypothetical protein
MRYRQRDCEERKRLHEDVSGLVMRGETKGRKQINHPNLQMEKAVLPA